MIRIAIVEDNERDYKELNDHIIRYGKEKAMDFDIKYFSDAVGFISDYQFEFDLIFLDIMMPDLSGINAAKKLRKIDDGVCIVFVTNMPQFAIEGYDVNAYYYLLKPLIYSDFAKKFGNVLTYILKETSGDFLFLEPPFEKRKVLTKEIKYIEVFAHDVVFHLFNEEIHVRGTLSEFEKKLDPSKFCRINSCYIVNLAYVTSIKNMSVYIDDTELRVSYTRKKVLIKALAKFAADSR